MASRIASLTDFASLAPPWQLSQLDQNSTNITSFANDSSLGYVNAISTDSGSANNYSVACVFGTPSAYNAGMYIAFIPANTNNGASVITVSPLGSLSIVDSSGNALQAGEIQLGRLCVLICMGSVFRLVSTLLTGGVPYYYDWDDFVFFPSSGSSKLLLLGNNGGSGPISGVYGTQIVGYPGIVQLAPGTTASGWARAIGGQIFLDTFTITLRSILQIPVGSFSGTNQFAFGLANPGGVGPVISASGFYIIFLASNTSGPNWFAETRNAATATTTSTGVAVTAGAMIDLMLVITAAQVQFYINQSLVVTTTTNIPASTQVLSPALWTNNGTGTSNFSLLGHTFEILITGQSVPVGNKDFLYGPI